MELGEVVLIKYRKFGVLILSLMILSVFAVLSVTAVSEENDSIEDVPELPLILQGGMDLDGPPVSAGCEIPAYYEGELIAKSTVGEGGRYSLYLNMTPENYTNSGRWSSTSMEIKPVPGFPSLNRIILKVKNRARSSKLT